MKKTIFSLCFVLAACAGVSVQSEPVSETDMGLSKTSVFDAPAPDAFDYGGKPPGTGNERFSKSYYTAPPQIPHSVAGLMPVTAKNNICIGCHVQPDKVGKPVQKGQPIPVPASHYEDPAYGKAEAGLKPTASKKLSGSRFVCTQCHRPQANVSPLVQSNFDAVAREKGIKKQ